ncbi:hypothetical protein [Priestia megaterium]|nr:hypothetical protein [Priestia megaterium]MDF2015018.1 hypothetical protein [Priestia megaterium]MED3934542.1 hypothetical protein [Priestia megaterium]NGY75824.1 hypothetical protein [Priestia megaterium]NGY75872.1 hypothetical protein [Priestia megaterium]
MDMFLRNINPIAVEKIDEMEKEKKISRQDFFKSRLKKEGGTERDKEL